MLMYLVTTLYVIVCLFLVLIVLLQQGKGGDIGSAFGGGGSQAAFGARTGATLLAKVTSVAAILFAVGALALGILGQRGPASVVGGTDAPATPPATSAPAQAPAETPATSDAAAEDAGTDTGDSEDATPGDQ